VVVRCWGNMVWNEEIYKHLDKNRKTFRAEGLNQENAEDLFRNYWEAFKFVLVDCYNKIITEVSPEIQIEIITYIMNNCGIKDKNKKGNFKDATTGSKIAFINHFNMFKYLNQEEFEITQINNLFKKIEANYLPLRNKGLDHKESAPTGFVVPKKSVTPQLVKQACADFDNFFRLLDIIKGNNLIKIIDNLPIPECIEFIGRNTEKRDILNYIKDPIPRLIAITGFGGFGKTELMKQVAYTLREGAYDFDALLWISFKRDKYDVDNDIILPIDRKNNFCDLNDVYNLILEKISEDHPEDIATYSEDTKKQKIRRILESKKIILFLDNYETLEDNNKLKKFVEDKYEELPKNLKVVVSCRYVVLPYKSRTIYLEAFTLNEVKQYINTQLKISNKEQNLSETFIKKIREKSFGHPFSLQSILKWIIEGKIDEHNIDYYLKALDSTSIGEFCFKKDYNSLPINARRLLCAACSKLNLNEEQLRRIAKILFKIDDFEFRNQINTLAKFNFLVNPLGSNKIIVPDMVYYYVRQMLPNETIEINNHICPLQTEMGQIWKKIQEEIPGVAVWEELLNDIKKHLSKNTESKFDESFKLKSRLEKIEELKKNDSGYYYYRSKVNNLLNENDAALKDISKACLINANNEEYIIFYSQLLKNSGKREEAYTLLKNYVNNSRVINQNVFNEFMDINDSFSEIKILSDTYLNPENKNHYSSIPIKLKLIKQLLYIIKRDLKDQGTTMNKEILIDMYTYIKKVTVVMIENKDQIYDDVFGKYMGNIIKSLRAIRQKFYGDFITNYYTSIKEYADQLQKRYEDEYNIDFG